MMESNRLLKFNFAKYNKVGAFLHQKIELCLLYAVHITQTLIQCFAASLQFLLSIKPALRLQSITAQIADDAKFLKRKPQHLALLISEDTVHVSDVANIIIWSTLAGIPCITISDKIGYLEKNSSKLKKEYEDRLKVICGDQLCSPAAHIHTEKYSGASYGTCNVILTSMASGRKQFVECVRSVSVSLSQDEESRRNFKADVLDQKYKEYNGNVGDPELAICFGSYLTSSGFQPWSMRLTEMISLSSHRNITYKKFLEALRQYARCEQRFGT